MTLKTWGYVIVDSLHPIYPSSLAWKRLVLPQETKEMLKAVTASTLRGINKVDGGRSDDNEEFKNNVETKKALKLLEKSTRHKPYDIVDSNWFIGTSLWTTRKDTYSGGIINIVWKTIVFDVIC